NLLIHRAICTDELVADESREEVMDQGPLVVPPSEPARGLEHPFLTHALCSHVLDDLVVELDDGLVELDDDQVLVVAFVADNRLAITVPRYVQDIVDIRLQQQPVWVV